MSKDGGPAFPDIVTDFDYHYESEQRWPNTYSHGGMMLRDYFAAAALTGLLANSHNDGVHKPLSHATALEAAEMAYKQADEMLKQREQRSGDTERP